MEDGVFRCRHCHRVTLSVKAEQRYCGQEACQKARKNAWRRAKYQLDPDYRATQRESTRSWLTSQGGSGAYYRRYRQRRRQTRQSGEQPGAPDSLPPPANANSDAESAQSAAKSRLYAPTADGGANSDAIFRFSVTLSIGCNAVANIDVLDLGGAFGQ
jgi:hypothetical protein